MHRSRFLVALLPLTLLASTATAGDEPSEWVIPTAQAPAVFALLPAEQAPLPGTDYRLRDIEIRRDHVEACFVRGAEAPACVVLVHPSRAGAHDRRTRHFAVRPAGSGSPALAETVASFIAQREQASPWGLARRAAGPPAGRGAPSRSQLHWLILIGLAAVAVGAAAWWLGHRR